MDHRPVDLLKKVLMVNPDVDQEFTYHTTEAFEKRPETHELARLEAQCMVKFRGLVRELTQEFGEPVFDGDMTDPDYPPWYRSMALAYWKRSGHYIYSAIRHDEPELPYILVYGISGTNSDLKSEGRTLKLS